MGRWIGIDYGTRRIGIAIGDPGEAIASPAETLHAAGSAPEDAHHLLDWARHHDAAGFVIGLPLNMDGSEGPQAQLSKELAEQLQQHGQLPVHLWDERLTTWQADRCLHDAGVRPSRRGELRDALAAQLILQSFLDARRACQSPRADDSPDSS